MRPLPVGVVERVMTSADVVLKTCVHEIARALEELTTSGEEVPLYATRIEFEDAAIRLALLLGVQPCSLKGQG